MRYAFVPFALLAVSSIGQGAAAPTAEPATPAAILDYYRHHNFVTAFSTREERQVLVANPEAAGDARLARVARLMRQLLSHVEPFDPGMTRSSVSAPAIVYRSDLLRINSIWSEDDEVTVELEALSIGPADSVFYVARFDELAGGDRVPGVDELLRIRPEANLLSAPERHRWRRVDGEWRRAATTMHFINW